MKLSKVEHLLDGSKLIFYFTAEGRVDFRELVRDLAGAVPHADRDAADRRARRGAAAWRLRIVRPAALLHHLADHVRAGLDQDGQAAGSGLNPSKLSGLCGRLKCCLRYELPNAKGVLRRRLRRRGRLQQPPAAAPAAAAAAGCGCGSEHRAASSVDPVPRIAHDGRRSGRHRSGDRRKAAADPRVRAVCEPIVYAPRAAPLQPWSADCRRPARRAYDAIVRAVRGCAGTARRGHRHGARQQGGVCACRAALARTHRSARRT